MGRGRPFAAAGGAVSVMLTLLVLGGCSLPGSKAEQEMAKRPSAETGTGSGGESQAGVSEAPVDGQAEAHTRKIAFFPAGDGAGMVKYQKVSGSSPWGPQALGAHPNGTVYVLDSVQRQVYAIDSKGGVDRFTLAKAWYPKDIYVAPDSLYVLDDDNWIRVYSLKGELQREVQLPEGLATYQVLRLGAHPSGQVSLWVQNYQELMLDELPSHFTPADSPRQVSDKLKGVAVPGEKRLYGELDGNGVLIRSTDGTVEMRVEAGQQFGSARMIAFDQRGDLYVLVEGLYPNGNKVGVELTARRYNQKGEMTGTARLPAEVFAIVPNRPVEVTPEGKVYMMTPLADGLSVYEVKMSKGN